MSNTTAAIDPYKNTAYLVKRTCRFFMSKSELPSPKKLNFSSKASHRPAAVTNKIFLFPSLRQMRQIMGMMKVEEVFVIVDVATDDPWTKFGQCGQKLTFLSVNFLKFKIVIKRVHHELKTGFLLHTGIVFIYLSVTKPSNKYGRRKELNLLNRIFLLRDSILNSFVKNFILGGDLNARTNFFLINRKLTDFNVLNRQDKTSDHFTIEASISMEKQTGNYTARFLMSICDLFWISA
ncbi:hypothetical protein BpHYR1_026835 [Brachionus plicatilis]|uniref:RNA-directed DNA polymerase from mobile element jockey-like n=1 Tax=Brachionus plicatilis TaxID=10195 RepID=A0A3M7P9K1_BRAPC|nr:hypothetical protein BpHYR1_026835 [Brachionus plicatilis]